MDGMAAGTAAGKPNALSRAWQCSDGRALFDFDIPVEVDPGWGGMTGNYTAILLSSGEPPGNQFANSQRSNRAPARMYMNWYHRPNERARAGNPIEISFSHLGEDSS